MGTGQTPELLVPRAKRTSWKINELGNSRARARAIPHPPTGDFHLLKYNKDVLWPLSSKVLVMHEVTRILSAIDQGDPHAAEQLLPLV